MSEHTWEEASGQIEFLDRQNHELRLALKQAEQALLDYAEREKELVAALEKFGKSEHYYCEDSWYSCPKAEGGCADESKGDNCNCGADAHNEAVAAALAKVKP